MEIEVVQGTPPQTPTNHCKDQNLLKRMGEILCKDSRSSFRELYQQFLNDPDGYATYSHKKVRKKYNSSAMYFVSLFTDEDFSDFPIRRKPRKCYQATNLTSTDTPCNFLNQLIKKGYSVSSMDFRYLLIENTDLSISNFAGSTFSGSLFVKCDFRFSNLAFVDFSHAIFIDCTFKGADLRGSNFSWSLLDSNTVSYLDTKNSYGPYFVFDHSSKQDHIHPDCEEITYSTLSYRDFVISQKDVYYGTLDDGSNFSRRLKKRKYVILDSSIKYCSFKNQDLRDSYFEGCTFEECDFSGALISEKTFGQYNDAYRGSEQKFSKLLFKRRSLEKCNFHDLKIIFKKSPNLLSHIIDEFIPVAYPIRQSLSEIPEKRSVLLSIEGQIKFIVESNLGINTDDLTLGKVKEHVVNDAVFFNSNAIKSELKEFDRCFKMLCEIRNKYSHSEYRKLVDYLKANNQLTTKKFLKKDEDFLKYIVNEENRKYTRSSQAIREDDLLAATYLYAFLNVNIVKTCIDNLSQSLIPLKKHIQEYAPYREIVHTEILSLGSSTYSLDLDLKKDSLKDATSNFKRGLDKATHEIYKSIQVKLGEKCNVRLLKPSESKIKSIIRKRIEKDIGQER